jgi:UDP-glucose:(galactosyl)LPS alpha-1,2-glucosyltransferase
MSSRRENPWLVVTACDDRYLWPWACALYSAVRNSDVPLRFVLANVNGLLSPLGQQNAKEFFAFLNVEGEIVDVSLDIAEVAKYQWNATIFGRLALLDIMSERFLWLDSDTILCSGWTTIFAIADDLMKDPHIVACGILDRPSTLNWLRKEGTNTAFQATEGAYVNTGILIVDPLRWRQGGMNRQWVGMVATQSERGFDFPDQDILNYLLAGKVGLLPARFNHIVSELSNGTELILHFAGAPKPWSLSESSRAVFIATEAASFDQARDPMFGSGQAWQLFPRYWEIERALISSLEEEKRSELASALMRHRDTGMTSFPMLQRMKFRGVRLLSRRVFSS